METRTTPSINFTESSKTNERSMSSVKPLREFQQMDWVPIDFGESFNKRRPHPNQKGMARALEVDFLPE
jgi:ribosomal protein L21E